MNSTTYSSQSAEVSIVVCHHVGNLLDGFIKSVTLSENVKYEVIVMTSDEELSLKGIKNCLVFHHTGLPAAKRNAGARIARGKYLAFFDDDVTIDPLCLYHLKDGIQGDIAMTYGRLWNMERRNRFDEAGGFLTWTGFIWSRAGQNDVDEGQYSKDELIFSGKSASCMVRKDIFIQVGGFDEDFGILGEESDLSWRIWLQNKKVLYAPQATGLHAFNCPTIKPQKKYYTNSRVFKNGCRNYCVMIIKNLGREHLWIIPIHLTIWFFAALVMLLTLKIPQGINILKGLWSILTTIPTILGKRKKIQQHRKINESALWPIISRKTPRGYWRTRFLRYITLGLHGALAFLVVRC